MVEISQLLGVGDFDGPQVFRPDVEEVDVVFGDVDGDVGLDDRVASKWMRSAARRTEAARLSYGLAQVS
jgi:hypothetical protein